MGRGGQAGWAPAQLSPERAVPQATLFDSQLTEGSHACTCDRVPSIVLSGEGECSLPAQGMGTGL